MSLAKVDVDENVEIAMEYAVKYLYMYMYSTVQAEILQFHVKNILVLVFNECYFLHVL